jgi:hypothetical protein
MNNKFEELIEYLTDKFDFEPLDGKYEYETIKETIEQNYKSLKCEELGDYRETIKEQIKELEKYKDEKYYTMFGHDWNFPMGICLGYVIFDSDFKFVDFIICT